MSRTIDDYLAAARARLGLPSDNQLARYLGLTQSAVSDYRTRRAWPDDGTMIRIAEAAGLDAGEALLDLNRWRTKSGPAQIVYERLRDLVGKSAAAVLVAVALGFVAPPAKADDGASARASGSDLNIMRLVMAVLRWIAGAAVALWPRLAHAENDGWERGACSWLFGLVAFVLYGIWVLRRERR